VGILCGAPGVLGSLMPDKLNPSPDEPPDRWELGTLPFESLAGVTAAAEYMLELGYDAIRAHEDGLMAIAASGLAEIDGVTLYGDPPDRVPTLMFNVAGFVHYNDESDARRLVAAVAEVASGAVAFAPPSQETPA
jgi:selenocysteine lyase/cysteine desulfurase